ncbi:uncharacterized protein LOC124439370 [Xenia sp. Carnegie-2017]|uniref:uncharacterized protein LOC124439370 n=1 Tax=Xenia sp. Carnegie-2017 TaxID=2897299 RepID=UPI001F04D0C8|nr:uncharacterized protein LOC124439370 [Xenia sp. Carnegie-2017]
MFFWEVTAFPVNCTASHIDIRQDKGLRKSRQEVSLASYNFNKGDCEEDWFQFNKNCYKVTTAIRNNHDANEHCSSTKAELVNIHSSSENMFIRTLANIQGSQSYIWIAVSKTTGVYNNWLPGKEGRGASGCVMMDLNGYWRAFDCGYMLPFVCKKAQKEDDTELQLLLALLIPILLCVSVALTLITALLIISICSEDEPFKMANRYCNTKKERKPAKGHMMDVIRKASMNMRNMKFKYKRKSVPGIEITKVKNTDDPSEQNGIMKTKPRYKLGNKHNTKNLNIPEKEERSSISSTSEKSSLYELLARLNTMDFEIARKYRSDERRQKDDILVKDDENRLQIDDVINEKEGSCSDSHEHLLDTRQSYEEKATSSNSSFSNIAFHYSVESIGEKGDGITWVKTVQHMNEKNSLEEIQVILIYEGDQEILNERLLKQPCEKTDINSQNMKNEIVKVDVHHNLNSKETVQGDVHHDLNSKDNVQGHVHHYLNSNETVQGDVHHDLNSNETVQGDVHQDLNSNETVQGDVHDDLNSNETIQGDVHYDLNSNETVQGDVHHDLNSNETVQGDVHHDLNSNETVQGDVHHDLNSNETVQGDVHHDLNSNETVQGDVHHDLNSNETVQGDVHHDLNSNETVQGDVHDDLNSNETVQGDVHHDLNSNETVQGDVHHDLNSNETVQGDVHDDLNSNETVQGDVHHDLNSNETVQGDVHHDLNSNETVQGDVHDDLNSNETVQGDVHDDLNSNETVQGDVHHDLNSNETVQGDVHHDLNSNETVQGDVHHDLNSNETVQGDVNHDLNSNETVQGDLHHALNNNKTWMSENKHCNKNSNDLVNRTSKRQVLWTYKI